MFGDGSDLKFSTNNHDLSIKDSISSMSYKKINKLITALYIVTDIIDPGEPMKYKLRSLGVEILSDMGNGSKASLSHKVATILSFLEISSTLNIISPMNFNILKKEFLIFATSIVESNQVNTPWLEDFFATNDTEEQISSYTDGRSKSKYSDFTTKGNLLIHKGHSIGQKKNTNMPVARIGVQPASTFLQALSDKTKNLSDMRNAGQGIDSYKIKNERREEIVKIIKDIKGHATITDIRNNLSKTFSGLSEKTLQRELVAMVKDNILLKIGEKRWSKYSLKNSS